MHSGIRVQVHLYRKIKACFLSRLNNEHATMQISQNALRLQFAYCCTHNKAISKPGCITSLFGNNLASLTIAKLCGRQRAVPVQKT